MTPDLFDVLEEARNVLAEDHSPEGDAFWGDAPCIGCDALAKLDALLALRGRAILCEAEPIAVIEATKDGFARIFIPADTELDEGDTLHRRMNPQHIGGME